MPRPVANTPSVRSTVVGYTVGAGLVAPNSNTTLTTANVPNDNATSLIGVDAVQYAIPFGGSVTLFFPNLPLRNNRVNPLTTTLTGQKPLTVLAQDTLIMAATPQSTTNPVDVQSFGYTRTDIKAPGPFLGSDTYLGFGVTITGPANSTGTVLCLLLLQRGQQ